MNHNHLSAAEVTAFREDKFSSKSLEAGRHLLTCRECRSKLPTVIPQEFRNCVLNSFESEHEQRSPKIQFGLMTFPLARATAFATFVLLLGAGLFIVGVKDRPAESEITFVPNEVAPGDGDVSRTQNPQIVSGPIVKRDDSPGAAAPRSSEELTHKPINVRKEPDPIKKATDALAKTRKAETRGAENPCTGEITIGIESRSNGKDTLLKWHAIKGAASYDVYISDMDENLIDHFESPSQTHYRSTLNLAPDKAYRWKLIVTLRNGSKIVGPPQTLKAAAVFENGLKLPSTERQRGTFTTRCVEAK